MTKSATTFSWLGQLAAAAILGQTLFFKFTGAQESRWIFGQLGVEPWGRIAAGVAELVCVALLLHPRTPALGALLTLGVIGGALVSHLLVLGIEVQGDGGLLFTLAAVTLACALLVLFLRRAEIPLVGCKLARTV
jgi:hypothetical protein